MQPPVILLFLTLVCFAPNASSAPSSEGALKGEPSNEEPASNTNQIEDLSLSITPVPEPARESKPEYRHRSWQSLTPRLGLFINPREVAEGEVHYQLGISMLAPAASLRGWEFDVDLVSNGTGLLAGGRRWIFYPENTFRPYLKAGLAHNLIPEQRLASLGRLSNQYLKLATGFEDLLNAPLSVRLEAEVLVNMENIIAVLLIGYSWAM